MASQKVSQILEDISPTETTRDTNGISQEVGTLLQDTLVFCHPWHILLTWISLEAGTRNMMIMIMMMMTMRKGMLDVKKLAGIFHACHHTIPEEE